MQQHWGTSARCKKEQQKEIDNDNIISLEKVDELSYPTKAEKKSNSNGNNHRRNAHISAPLSFVSGKTHLTVT
ncbi:hypothetical protein DERF_010994 [Dermatophagoides farinae]|uniref:Uncharacterized protein n=1 Tax=Dermatophagoides farinae TaxID=6954 RepID=A0A922HW82_DERFA|nr:hypothetical protein DERF_010994 [Dermatophagoides farinae]